MTHHIIVITDKLIKKCTIINNGACVGSTWCVDYCKYAQNSKKIHYKNCAIIKIEFDCNFVTRKEKLEKLNNITID